VTDRRVPSLDEAKAQFKRNGGTFVSSGCIRLTNEDITDLFTRVKVGTRVVVLPSKPVPVDSPAGVIAVTPSGVTSPSDMPRKRHKPEEIAGKLRQVDVLVSQGQSITDAIRQRGLTEGTYYRWRQEVGGLKRNEVKRPQKPSLEKPRTPEVIVDRDNSHQPKSREEAPPFEE
jgi:putative transposase